MDFKKYIEDIKDFPEEGIIFRDVTPLLKDKEAYKESIDTFAKWIDGLGVQVDVVAGPEARGFLFGCPVAYKVNDIVTYQSKTYKCLQAHTSQQTWNPVAAASLWKLQ